MSRADRRGCGIGEVGEVLVAVNQGGDWRVVLPFLAGAVLEGRMWRCLGVHRCVVMVSGMVIALVLCVPFLQSFT